MLTGKSPSTICLPTGRRNHWLGNLIAPSGCCPGRSMPRAAAEPGGVEEQAARDSKLIKASQKRHFCIPCSPLYCSNWPAGKGERCGARCVTRTDSSLVGADVRRL